MPPSTPTSATPKPQVLGASVGHENGQAGTWFRLESTIADAVELCLFDQAEPSIERAKVEMARVEVTRVGEVFETFVPGIGPGDPYGFRVHGPWEPSAGHRCNPNKLLLDPRARLMSGRTTPSAALLGHDPTDHARASTTDSAPNTMRSVVTADDFDWEDVRRPATPISKTVIYETHVKGMTARNPGVPKELRGTYAGMAHPSTIDHLTSLGITAVELMPVHQFVHDEFLQEVGRRNYWGYNTIGFFAPHAEYAATTDPIAEFKGMVKALHRAGIEVILDVVYNHTAEGNHLGPTLCFRGIDNAMHYRLEKTDRSTYVNWTGTGNTLDLGSPVALRLVMDSLRMWAAEFHIDGFRFDLATVLGRTWGPFDPLGGFFGSAGQDPILTDTKLIAEPWDVGVGGYQVGGYPRGWSEWNDKFRDTTRDFWRGQPGSLAHFATRLTGSSDVFWSRSPTASVNFITSHDGFTLRDLVSYDERHNEENGENGHDGHSDNRSWNSGAEGPSEDTEINNLRRRRVRSMLATLLLSQGVPMLLGGDEIDRTQGGNNNAYNQDNGLSWYDWDNVDADLTEYVKGLIGFRREHPTFRRTAWLHEHAAPQFDHVGWYMPSGEEMTPDSWHDANNLSVGLYLRGDPIHCEEGTVVDDDFLLIFNGGDETISFTIPPDLQAKEWFIATASGECHLAGQASLGMESFSFALVQSRRGGQ